VVHQASQDPKDEALASLITHCEGKRYLFRPKTNRKGRPNRFSDNLPPDLPTAEAAAVKQSANECRWLNDDEFLQKHCMSRFAFDWVLDQIEDCQVFTTVGNNKEGRPQAPVIHQLMVFLKYIGTEGSGTASKNQRNMFGIGEGSLDVYRDCVMKAILKLKPIYYGWPNKEEQKKFPNVVEIADRTLLPLAFEPQTEDAPDHKGRKHLCTLTVMIVCDYDHRICCYHAGFPGSAHDMRVYRNMDLFLNPQNYFSENEFNIGDSAFLNSLFMVASFKKQHGEEMTEEHEKLQQVVVKG